MKFISMNQLKASNEPVPKIIEDVIDINTENLSKTCVNIENIISDLEKVKEGLFYKKDDLERDLKERNIKNLTKDFYNLEKRISKIHIKENACVRNILDIHRELENEKYTYRILSTLNEIIKGNVEILDTFLENEDEWLFLSGFLKCILLESNDPNLNGILNSYVKKIEEKLVDVFKEANIEKNATIMRKSYDALKEIDKQSSLLKAYIFSFSVFHENKNFKKEKETLELDLYENNENSFVQTVMKIEEIYQEEFSDLSSYFSDYKNIIEMLNIRIFGDVLSRQLEFLLETKDPVIFLLDLKLAYEKVKSLADLITVYYPETNIKESMDDLFSPYLINVIYKEKEAIDMLYNILTRKIKPKKHYIIQGEGLYLHDFKPYRSFDKLTAIFGLSIERINVMNYDQDDVKELNEYFIKKIKSLISFINLNFLGEDRLVLIKFITDIYIVTKRFLGNSIDLESLEKDIEERIHVIYKNRLDESEVKTKQIVKSLSIDDFESGNTKMIKKLVSYLKTENEKIDFYMKGPNGKKFLTQILIFTCKKLRKQYFLFKYDQKRALIFKDDMAFVLETVKEMKIIEAINNFEEMYEISEIVASRKEDLNICIKSLFSKFTEDDIKKIMKLREDYNEAKKIIF